MQSTGKTGFASLDRPHLAYYDREKTAVAFEGLEMTADAFLWKHCTGDQRKDYACDFMGIHTTYGELNEEIERVARALMGYGVRQGDYVSIMLPCLKEALTYTYACWRIGAITNLLDPRIHSRGIAERAQLTKSKLLVTVMNICDPKIDEILDDLPPVIVVSPSDSLKPCLQLKATLGYFLYNAKKRKFAKGRMDTGAKKYIWHTDFIRDYTYEGDILAKYEPDMVAAVMYTSGTSSDGLTKGAVHTHAGINAMPRAYKCSGMHGETNRGLTFGGFLPFFAAYGVFCGMHASLCGGMEIILIPLFDPEKFVEMVLKYKPNIIMGVPRFFEQFARHPKLQKPNNLLSFIKIPASGGDKISPASLEKVNETFARSGYAGGLRVGYGSTELGGSISVMQNYQNDKTLDWRAPGNVGYLLPHCRAMVVDPETMEELPYGQDGELCVNSLCMMQGYLDMPEQTEEITHIGPDGTKYYRMGDKGHMDENGVFYFIDRYKRSIMRPDSHSVHPSPIESAITTHEAVLNCAVVGLPHDDMAGTVPTAFVQLRPGYDTEEARRKVLLEIDAMCLQILPERDRAIAYTAVEELPYTPMGKIHFRELEKVPFDEHKFVLTDFAFFPNSPQKP